jgi:hypothetical protein
MSIVMNDTCRIAQISEDGYGDRDVELLTTVDCLFLQGTGDSHSNNAEIATADAHVYLDIYNEVIRGKAYRLEGMYLVINPFGADGNESWYKITRVKVGQKKLTDNEVDNVHAFLQKVSNPGYNGVY